MKPPDVDYAVKTFLEFVTWEATFLSVLAFGVLVETLANVRKKISKWGKS